MEITITDAAIKKIGQRIDGKVGFLKLKYDTEGCGCVVSGITALWLVDNLEDEDMAIETNDITIYIEKSKAVFLDEKMKVDFSESSNTFQLKSPNQILNGRMSFYDQTK